MNLALAGLSYGITVVALVLLALRTTKLIGIYKKGQPDPTRGNDKAQRFKMAFGEIFGHTKMFNFTVVGFAHWFVMIGFFVLFGTLVTAYGQLVNPHFALPIIGHLWVYEYLTELIAWATGIGIVALIGIRQLHIVVTSVHVLQDLAWVRRITLSPPSCSLFFVSSRFVV